MKVAKTKEIRTNMLQRGTFKVVLKEEIRKDGNVIPGRFGIYIKSQSDGCTNFEATYVVGGHPEELNILLVHSSCTIQTPSIRLLITIPVMFRFYVWTSDVRKAYLQSAIPLDRDILILIPLPEFKRHPQQCLQLLKSLYGLFHSGDLWHSTLDGHHRQHQNMKTCKLEPSQYFLCHCTCLLIGLSGTYLDDVLRAGDGSFKENS